MRIIFFQNDRDGLLPKICKSQPAGTVLLEGMVRKAVLTSMGDLRVLLPQQWLDANPELKRFSPIVGSELYWFTDQNDDPADSQDVILINGQYVFSFDELTFLDTIKQINTDVIFLRIRKRLQAGRELIRMTSDQQIVGYRRLYEDAFEPAVVPEAWPSVVYLKSGMLQKISGTKGIPLCFNDFLKRITSLNLSVMTFQAGGFAKNLRHAHSVLDFLEESMTQSNALGSAPKNQSRCIGPVLLGKNVDVGENALLIGPIILCDNVRIGSNAVIRRAIVGADVAIENKQCVNNEIILNEGGKTIRLRTEFSAVSPFLKSGLPPHKFKEWRFFSYARLGKRIFDLIFSICILIMLIPIFPVVALIVKLTSAGPIFYRARRQGLHGREFDCLKFRTMMVQADAMQDRLRIVNQVDGPQFKIDHDPRITGIGKFLRDTSIDELPQFINVLLGQMSVVGPRPSPAKENESRPVWRDARLSVCPGITGLWQVMRTRQASMDFQEWIYYDTEYVRKLSFRKDIWICFKTAQHLISSFLDQFG